MHSAARCSMLPSGVSAACARYGGIDYALEANARLVALLVQSGRMAEATPHESAVRNLCATQLTGWRGFLRKYVAYGAPRSLMTIALSELSVVVVDDEPRSVIGLVSVDDMGHMGYMADLGAAYAMARLYAGLQHADAAVAELTKACDMGLAEDGVDNDELFEVVSFRSPKSSRCSAHASLRTAVNGLTPGVIAGGCCC